MVVKVKVPAVEEDVPRDTAPVLVRTMLPGAVAVTVVVNEFTISAGSLPDPIVPPLLKLTVEAVILELPLFWKTMLPVPPAESVTDTALVPPRLTKGLIVMPVLPPLFRTTLAAAIPV